MLSLLYFHLAKRRRNISVALITGNIFESEKPLLFVALVLQIAKAFNKTAEETFILKINTRNIQRNNI